MKDKGIKLSKFVHELGTVRPFEPLSIRQYVEDCFAIFFAQPTFYVFG